MVPYLAASYRASVLGCRPCDFLPVELGEAATGETPVVPVRRQDGGFGLHEKAEMWYATGKYNFT